jgi:PAS domain S-box-containing protein
MQRYPDGRPKHVHGTVHDITEKVEAAAAWQAVLSDTSDAIVGMSDDGFITLFNPSAERMFGYSAADAIGKPVTILMQPEDARRHTAALAKRTQNAGQDSGPIEADAVRADGSTIPVELVVSGTRRGFLAIIRDISARRAADAQRSVVTARERQHQKLEALGTLASGIAHDFNNLLTPIMTYAFLLSEEEDEARRSEMLKVVRQAAERGADLVGQILSFGRTSHDDAAPLDVVEVVRGTASMLRASLPKNIDVQVALPGSHWSIGDAGQLQTALLNLGVNASQAMPDGGTLRLSVGRRAVSCEEAALEGVAPGDYIAIAVQDTGAGIPEHVLARIFEPFFTTKPVGEGTGMGLASAHGIFKSHGGALAVDTRVGEGTTFTAIVPLRAPLSATASEPGSHPGVKGAMRVLVVDDDDVVLTATVQLLQRLGMKTTAFASTAEALATLAEAPDSFDAALVDYTMPERSGIETSRLLREVQPQLPIVLTTGRNNHALAAEARRMDLVGPLPKPSRPAQLVSAIEAAVAGVPWQPAED